MIRVEYWGSIQYPESYTRQRQIVEDVLAGEDNRLIFCEHPPVITLGRLTKPDSLIYTRDEIQAQGIAIIPVDRGGDVTMHMPGQLVVYIIVNLNKYGKDLKIYMQRLEQVAVDLLKSFGILAISIEGKRGVFVGDKKIVSIGIGVRKWVAFHGLGINVNNDLSLYRYIKPCGLDVQMTNITQMSKSPVTISDVQKEFLNQVQLKFGVL